MIKPRKEKVAAYDLSYLQAHITNDRALDFYNGEPGIEHYKLLAHLSDQFHGKVLIEVGTLDGTGALALAHNSANDVVTYDVTAHPTHAFPPNVDRRIIKPNEMPDLTNVALIFYDASHDGTQERWFLDNLIKMGWKGIVVWDDIHLTEPMRNFWRSVTQRKEDWTDIGHGVVYEGHQAGTGVTWIE